MRFDMELKKQWKKISDILDKKIERSEKSLREVEEILKNNQELRSQTQEVVNAIRLAN